MLGELFSQLFSPTKYFSFNVAIWSKNLRPQEKKRKRTVVNGDEIS